MISFIPYIAAGISSACFGVASVFEQKAAFTNSSLAGLNMRSFLELARNYYYIAGLGLDVLGFIFFTVAVRFLPLFFVQAVDTASIVVAIITARFLLGTRTHTRDYRFIALLLVGLSMLLLASSSETSRAVSGVVRNCVIGAGLTTAILGIAFSKQLARHPQLTAFASGLCFSIVAVAIRVITVHGSWLSLAVNPLVLILAINGVLGIMLFSTALQVGSIAYVYSINFVTETVVPTIIGLTLLGDTPFHNRWALLVAGLILTIVSTSALAARNGDSLHAQA